MMKRTALCALVAFVIAGLDAFASSTSDLLAVRVGRNAEVTPGVWHADLNKARTYAEENGLPLVAVWSNGERCGRCIEFEKCVMSPAFRNWMKDSGIVFYFGVSSDSNDGQEGYHGTSFYWCCANQSATMSWPYVRVYWPKGGIDACHSGSWYDGEDGGKILRCTYSDNRTDPDNFIYPGDYNTYNPGGRRIISILVGDDTASTVMPEGGGLATGGLLSGYWVLKTEVSGDYTWQYRINCGAAETCGNAIEHWEPWQSPDGSWMYALWLSYTPAVSPDPSGSVSVPSTLGGWPVTVVGDGTFYDCCALEYVEIPSCVTNIGLAAFQGCVGLRGVELPDGLEAIESGAFKDCCSLEYIEIPDSVTRIGWDVFYGCGGSLFDTATIPGVKLVDGWAVGFTESLSGTLNLAGVRGMGEWAFSDCCALEYVEMPDGATRIVEGAFYGCTSLTAVKLPAGLKEIDDLAFCDCCALGFVEIPDSVTSVGAGAFSECYGLTNVVFKGGMDSMGIMNVFYAFDGTPWLEAYLASLPKPANDSFSDATLLAGRSGTAIGSNVAATEEDGDPVGGRSVWWRWTAPADGTALFHNSGETSHDTCLVVFSGDSLDALEVIAGVYYTGAAAEFEVTRGTTYSIGVGGYGMGDVALSWSLATDPEYSKYDSEEVGGYTWLYRINGDSAELCGTLTSGYGSNCMDGSVLVDGPVPAAYNILPAVSPQPIGYVEVPSMLGGCPVTSVTEGAFYGCGGLTGVRLPSGLEVVGDDAFCGCCALEYIDIPDGVTGIGSGAFGNCSHLASVSIGSGVEFVSDWAFDGCSSLARFEVSDGNLCYQSVNGLLLTKEGDVLVQGVNGQVEVPSGVKHIGESAFYGLGGLTRVVLPEGLEAIDAYAFGDCCALEYVEIPDSVRRISCGAFDGCNESLFDEVTMPGAALVDGWAVGNTASLPAVLFMDGIRGVVEEAFWGCSALEYVVVPDGIKGIGDYAFADCENLTEVEFECGMDTIDMNVFRAFAGTPWLEEYSVSILPSGSCMKKPIQLQLGDEKHVVLVDEFDPYEGAFLGQGICCFKVRLAKSNEYTIWIEGGDAAEMDLDVFVDDDDENAPSAEFDVMSYMNGVQAAFVYDDYWYEDDPNTGTYYVCLRGDIGQQTTLFFTRGIREPCETIELSDGTEIAVQKTWLAEHTDRSATATAANGRKVWECYALGLDPENTTNDFKIVSFPVKADGTPDLANIVFDPMPDKWNIPAARPVLKGATVLDGPWTDVEGKDSSSFKFFKVEVKLP